MDNYNTLSDEELVDEIRRVWGESWRGLLMEAHARRIEIRIDYTPPEVTHVFASGAPANTIPASASIRFTKTNTL